jgi:hypothetical protein
MHWLGLSLLFSQLSNGFANSATCVSLLEGVVESCSSSLHATISNLTTVGIPNHFQRLTPTEYQPPSLDTAFLFSNAQPMFVISTPVFIAEGHIEEMMNGIWNHTTGLWAWDLLLDASPDGSKEVILRTIWGWVRDRLSEPSHLSPCHASDGAVCRCLLHSVPTVIRLIVSSFPIWETKADNFVFSSQLYLSSLYSVSVQADQRLTETAWNLYLSLPVAIWSDDVLSVSALCAQNIYERRQSHTLFAFDEVCAPRSSSSERTAETDFFDLRMSSIRGPLLFSSNKLRQLGFFNERNYVLGLDDHDLHVRGYLRYGYRTGLATVGLEMIPRNRSAEHELKKKRLRESQAERRAKERMMAWYLRHREGGRERGRSVLEGYDELTQVRSVLAGELTARDPDPQLTDAETTQDLVTLRKRVTVGSAVAEGAAMAEQKGAFSERRLIRSKMRERALSKCDREMSSRVRRRGMAL